MVTVTIDGKTLEIPEGTTVLRAAQNEGIEIPTLCDHPHLTPYGGCRLCLVEVEGYRTLQPSCTLPVSNNMVIKTNTKKVLDARKFVLTLIFSERNHFCPYCQVSGGDCELQNAAYNEGMTHWPLQPNWQPYPVDASHPYIILENNRCILCRRCVRACAELIGNFTLGFEERGARSILVADTGVPFGESTCISCGSCVQVCPTGALIDRTSSYMGHEVKFDSTKTICVGCSLGCGIEVFTRDNNLVRIDGDWDDPFNAGVICEIGRYEPLTDKCDRIHTPMIRKDGVLKAATWDEALSAAEAGLGLGKPGSSAKIAALVSSRQPAETLYNINQLFNTGFVSTIDGNTFTSALRDLAEKVEKPFETKVAKLKESDSTLVLGIDLSKDHQVAGFFIKRKTTGEASLVVVDSGENALDRFANKTLKTTGAYEDVIKGLSAAADKLGLTKGKAPVKASELEEIAKKTGLSTDDYLDAAYLVASAEKPAIVFEGKTASSLLVEFANAIQADLIGLKGSANNLTASQLHLDKPFHAADYQAVYVALGDDGVSQKMLQELQKIPFKVVQASYDSALTAAADVVLPATIWLEQSGHYLSTDGRLLEAVRAITPEEDIWTIDKTLEEFAEKLGLKLHEEWADAIFAPVTSVELVT